jgi:hypothetical protein
MSSARATVHRGTKSNKLILRKSTFFRLNIFSEIFSAVGQKLDGVFQKLG